MPSILSFRGRHNLCKARLLLALFLLNRDRPRNSYTVTQLVKITGLSTGYVAHRAPDFLRWGYLKREYSRRGRALVACYYIAGKGQRYARELPRIISDQVMGELNTYSESAAGAPFHFSFR